MSPAALGKVVAAHQRWLRGETGGERADLRGADLRGADLRGANLEGAYLEGADLRGADLRGADLRGANLEGAYLEGASLASANLEGAYLYGAYLRGADLRGADLWGADITGATMPDGRVWEQYRVDHLAGICSEPQVIARALAAWGEHDWRSCPMHSALGIDGLDGIEDVERRRLVACWVALYDAGHLSVDGAVRS